jgi:hypothetical protein
MCDPVTQVRVYNRYKEINLKAPVETGYGDVMKRIVTICLILVGLIIYTGPIGWDSSSPASVNGGIYGVTGDGLCSPELDPGCPAGNFDGRAVRQTPCCRDLCAPAPGGD